MCCIVNEYYIFQHKGEQKKIPETEFGYFYMFYLVKQILGRLRHFWRSLFNFFTDTTAIGFKILIE